MLGELRTFLLQSQGERTILQRQLERGRENLEKLQKQEVTIRAAEELAVASSLVAQQQIKERFERLATTALRWVYYDQELALKVELGTRGTSPSLDFLIEAGGVELDPLSAAGGGVVQVLALVLRLTILEALHVNGPLLLDEPLSQLSRNYQERAGTFLKEYAKRTGRQILLVTHSPELFTAASKVFRVRLSSGRSIVTEVALTEEDVDFVDTE